MLCLNKLFDLDVLCLTSHGCCLILFQRYKLYDLLRLPFIICAGILLQRGVIFTLRELHRALMFLLLDRVGTVLPFLKCRGTKELPGDAFTDIRWHFSAVLFFLALTTLGKGRMRLNNCLCLLTIHYRSLHDSLFRSLLLIFNKFGDFGLSQPSQVS